MLTLFHSLLSSLGLIGDTCVTEPTTGLDSTAAFSIVSYLVKIAKETGVAVIMTIHQPSALVFNMLDDLLLLENGHVVYGGHLREAGAFFAGVGLHLLTSI